MGAANVCMNSHFSEPSLVFILHRFARTDQSAPACCSCQSLHCVHACKGLLLF